MEDYELDWHQNVQMCTKGSNCVPGGFCGRPLQANSVLLRFSGIPMSAAPRWHRAGELNSIPHFIPNIPLDFQHGGAKTKKHSERLSTAPAWI